jgi:hypothetical protein
MNLIETAANLKPISGKASINSMDAFDSGPNRF